MKTESMKEQKGASNLDVWSKGKERLHVLNLSLRKGRSRQGDGSAVDITYCFSREPEFGS